MDIKICPKCGHELIDVIVTLYPVVATKEECTSCDWMGEYTEHPNAFKER